MIFPTFRMSVLLMNVPLLPLCPTVPLAFYCLCLVFTRISMAGGTLASSASAIMAFCLNWYSVSKSNNTQKKKQKVVASLGALIKVVCSELLDKTQHLWIVLFHLNLTSTFPITFFFVDALPRYLLFPFKRWGESHPETTLALMHKDQAALGPQLQAEGACPKAVYNKCLQLFYVTVSFRLLSSTGYCLCRRTL